MKDIEKSSEKLYKMKVFLQVYGSRNKVTAGKKAGGLVTVRLFSSRGDGSGLLGR